MTIFALWRDSWPQSMSSLPPRWLEWPLWEAVAWWLRGCPEHHSFYWYWRRCGQGHLWAEWKSHWHSLLCPHPQCVSHRFELPSGESRYQSVPRGHAWLHGGPDLSPVTLTVATTLPSLLLGLALPSRITLSSSFPGMTTHFSAAMGGGPYDSNDLPGGVRAPGPPAPEKAQEEKKPSASGESQLYPQNTENLLSSMQIHPRPREDRERLRESYLVMYHQ